MPPAERMSTRQQYRAYCDESESGGLLRGSTPCSLLRLEAKEPLAATSVTQGLGNIGAAARFRPATSSCPWVEKYVAAPSWRRRRAREGDAPPPAPSRRRSSARESDVRAKQMTEDIPATARPLPHHRHRPGCCRFFGISVQFQARPPLIGSPPSSSSWPRSSATR
jgi:hypothetical protein